LEWWSVLRESARSTDSRKEESEEANQPAAGRPAPTGDIRNGCRSSECRWRGYQQRGLVATGPRWKTCGIL